MGNKINNVVDIPISEVIFCKDGWNKVENININDEVYGIDGKLHKVIDIKYKNNQCVYKIEFRDGTFVKLGERSILRVATKKQEENMKKYGDIRFKNIILTDILNDFQKVSKFVNKAIYVHKYSCLPIKPIQFKSIELPLNFYLLGLLLGDGGFTGNVMTFTNAEDDIIKDFEKIISDIGLEAHYKHFENHEQLYICSKNSYSENILNTKLKQLKLFGADSRQKFIPDIYKKACIDDRLLLLSGIINTDGSVDENGVISICTYSFNMYNDIKDICYGLGLTTTFAEYDRTNEFSTKKYDKEIEYRINILEENYDMLKLSEKHSEKLKNRKKFSNKIININKIDNSDTISIILDNDEKVILNNYVAI